MASELKLRRGSNLAHTNFIGAQSEVTFNTDTKTLHVHDGATAGGLPLARVSETARVVDSIAALRALDKTKFTRAFVTGYYAAGDGGGGAYWYDSTDVTSADNGGTIIVATNGGRWKLQIIGHLSVKQFGAKGDGATDDTAAIQAAIDALGAMGGALHFPKSTGAYMVSRNGATSYCLLIAAPINLTGEGMYGAINPIAGTPGTVHTFYVQPNPAYAFYGMTWRDLHIGNPATGTLAGGSGIYLDTTVAGANLPKFTLTSCTIEQGSGPGVSHLNSAVNNVNGGLYAALIQGNTIKGGVSLASSGDSNVIFGNLISGTGTGVYASLVSGASELAVENNNITTSVGAIKLDAGSRFRIRNNNIEQQVAGGSNAAMIDINGASGTMANGIIEGNHLGAFTGTGITANIRVRNSIMLDVRNNTLLPASASTWGVDIASSTDVRVGWNQLGTGGAGYVTDAGTGTVGVHKTPTLLNGWVAYAGYTAPYFWKDEDGVVHLEGQISSGTATAGTVVFTLPPGFIPSFNLNFPTLSLNPGYVVGAAVIDTGGNVMIYAGGNTLFSLSGIAFSASGGNKTSSNL